jgi:cytochrome c oxidase cbb3-type subunit III
MKNFVAISAGLGAVAFAVVCMHAGRAQEAFEADGPALFESNCAACHGSDGASSERAPDIASRREVVSRSDGDLTRIVRDGVPGTGMPGFGYLGEQKVGEIVRHLRALQGIHSEIRIPGNAEHGEALFFGKADCGRCHMVNGHGGFQASDLSGYGRGHTAAEIRHWILDPDEKLDRSALIVTVTTKDGARWQGRLRCEDNFSLVLQTNDGVFRFFYRDRLARVEYSGHSAMPLDYKSRLIDRELDDLVSYILRAKMAENAAAVNDDDD